MAPRAGRCGDARAGPRFELPRRFFLGPERASNFVETWARLPVRSAPSDFRCLRFRPGSTREPRAPGSSRRGTRRVAGGTSPRRAGWSSGSRDTRGTRNYFNNSSLTNLRKSKCICLTVEVFQEELLKLVKALHRIARELYRQIKLGALPMPRGISLPIDRMWNAWNAFISFTDVGRVVWARTWSTSPRFWALAANLNARSSVKI